MKPRRMNQFEREYLRSVRESDPYGITQFDDGSYEEDYVLWLERELAKARKGLTALAEQREEADAEPWAAAARKRKEKVK